MLGRRMLANGRLVPVELGRFGLDDADALYGYGCYETLKVRGGLLYFAEFHEERLLRSAAILGIAHGLRPGELVRGLRGLVEAEAAGDCNVKAIMIGRSGRPADWYAFLLPPLVPPATAYSAGVPCLLYRGERHFPAAKSLSMLLSTVAFRAAAAAGCYDALLVDRRGEITEGTRTNLVYARRGDASTIYTPPADRALEGITRRTLIAALAEAGVAVAERPLSVAEALSGEYALAVTSTSSRVIQVAALLPVPGETAVATDCPRSPELASAAAVYDAYLERYSMELS